MRYKEVIAALIVTLFVLIIFNIVETATLPALGFSSFKIPLNILIILYLSFKVRVSYLSVIILLIQYTNSFFTIEHWTEGTIAGVFTLWILNYLRDIIHLTSFTLTVLVTLAFSFVWFFITAVLMYVQLGDFAVILTRFGRFVPQAMFISLIAPFIFQLLDRVWRTRVSSALEG